MTLFWALACAAPDGEAAAERVAFVEGRCEALATDHLHDDCRVARVAADPARAEVECAAVRAPAMRDECRFVAVDALALVGDAAASACDAAGRYAGACRANVVSREVSALPPLAEPALRQRIAHILVTQRRPPRELDDLVRRRLAAQ